VEEFLLAGSSHRLSGYRLAVQLYIFPGYERYILSLLASGTEPVLQTSDKNIQPKHVLLRESEVDMWLPDKLYELLPFLYGIAGLATYHQFDTANGYASGLLLMLTCLVWVMRRDYRHGDINKRKVKHQALHHS
jgi:hypothetical protein